MANNSSVDRLPQVKPIDTWDGYGMQHDRALARARSRGDLVVADSRYAMDTISHGILSLNATEALSGVIVGTAGTLYHQVAYDASAR